MNEIEQKILEWRYDNVKFVYEGLCWRKKGWTITKQQKEGLNALQELVNAKIKKAKGLPLNTHESEIAIKMGISMMSGHGTGKSTTLSICLLWFMTCFPEPRSLCTAPTRKQLGDVLWAEIAKQLKDSAIENLFTLQSEKLYLNMATEYKGKEWWAAARTINTKATPEQQGETLAGRHAPYMMFCIDEASGIPDPVFKPLEGGLTGMCNVILLGFNPTKRKGFAIESQTKYRKDWMCLHWDSEDSEIVDRAYVQRMEDKYGRDSNVFRIRVKGLPPLDDDDSLIPCDWIEDAIDRDIDFENYRGVLSVDVGAGSDITAICLRQGGMIFNYVTSNDPNTVRLAELVLETAAEFEPYAITIDVIGVGHGLYYQLKDYKTNFTVYPVDFRRKSTKEDRFPRLRDELWWATRERFEKGTISIPRDNELIDELKSINYIEHYQGSKIKIEDKRDFRRKQRSSPNRADALVMSFYLKDLVFRKSYGISRFAEPETKTSPSFGRGFMAA